MMPVILVLLLGYFALAGFGRLVAPAGRLKIEKNPPETSSVDRNKTRLRQIRRRGAVQFCLCAAMLFLIRVRIGLSISPQPSPKPDVVERLAFDHGADFLRRGKANGLAIALITGEREVVVELGHARGRIPVSKETLFEIGSITKVFTGIALAREIESGALKLDNTASSLLPAGFALSEEARSVTLRQLTTHTAGFPRMPGTPRIVDLANFILFGGDPYVGITLERFNEALRTVKLNATPGQKMEYSNFGVSFLGWLLSQRKTNTYENYIREQVLEPLGMRDTAIQLDRPARDRLAQGYRSIKKLGPLTILFRSTPWNLANHLAPAGGLRSTGSDMLKFLRANMHPEMTPIGQAIRRSHQELFRENERQAVAMNWMRTRKSNDSKEIIWHNGGTGGFMSFLGFREDGSCGVVILANASESVDALGMNLLRALSERTPPR